MNCPHGFGHAACPICSVRLAAVREEAAIRVRHVSVDDGLLIGSALEAMIKSVHCEHRDLHALTGARWCSGCGTLLVDGYPPAEPDVLRASRSVDDALRVMGAPPATTEGDSDAKKRS